ncbi:MAG: ribonuclease HIII [Waddliaceae bacterium]
MSNSQKKPSLFVAKVDLSVAEKLMGDLRSKGFTFSTPPYTIFSAKKKGLSCTLYQSGKLMVQGKETQEFVEFYLEPEVLGTFTNSYREIDIDQTSRIGIDEAGKGDFFGPLCIAGVFASGPGILQLKKMGVRDSKSMSDSTVIKIGSLLRKHYPYHIVTLTPATYNDLYKKFGNLNHLLAWGHATAISALVQKTECINVIIDQFASEHVVENALKKKNLNVDLVQRHRGEEDLVVAAASILARQAFLEELERLSREFSMKLPKGAASIVIETGGKFLMKYGRSLLAKVAKLHFRTLDAILSENPEYR